MREFTGLLASRESLMANGRAINAVADNLSNANTPGFKTERVEFSSLLASGQGALFDPPDALSSGGNGVQVQAVSTLHDVQGAVETTNRSLDFAITGKGFFVVNDGTTNYFTRAGDFRTDTAGNLVSQAGDSVLGFTTASPTTAVALNVTNVTNTASPTTTATLAGNLSSESAITTTPTATTTFNDVNGPSSFRQAVEVVDSTGAIQQFTIYFYKTGLNTWAAQAYADVNKLAGGTLDATPAPSGVLGTAALTFTDGALPAASTMTVNASWLNGGTSAVTVDLSQMKQFANPSGLTSFDRNGNPPGNLASLELQPNGTIMAILDNGERVSIGTVALASFASQDGLERLGGGKFAATEKSGDATIGNPNAAGLGSLRNSALESSTTDPAVEFVNMIRYQRGYQASSKVLQTINEIINGTLQIA